MDRETVLRRIKACFDRAKGTDSENEAAICLRQAQKLMEKYGVTDQDLGLQGFGKERVDTTIQRGRGRYNKKTKKTTPAPVPTTLAVIVNLMAHAFGVSPIVGSDLRETDDNWHVTYYGPEDRVLLASYAHTVVARTVEAGWQRFLRENPHYKGRVGGRAGFYIGWIHGVRKQVEAFAMTPDEVERTQLVIKQDFGTSLVKLGHSNQKVSGRAMDAGQADGASFKLHRPVGNERLKLEDKS